MKKYLLLLALVCLLGNWALAQNSERTTYTMTAEMQDTIDFTGWNVESNWDTSGRATFTNNQLISATGKNNTDGSTLTRDYTQTYPNNKQQFLVYVGAGDLGDAYSSTTSTNIWSGNQQFNNWNVVVRIANSINVKAGDILRFNITNKQNNFNPVLKQGGTTNDFFNNSGGNPQGPYIPFPREATDNYFQWTVTDNNDGAIQAIINSGVTLQGLGFTLTSVELISTSTDNSWHIWTSRDHNETYLQKAGANDDYFTITGLKQGDKIIIWGDNGQGNVGGCTVVSNNTNRNNQRFQFATTWTDPNNSNNVISLSNKGCDEIVMQNDGDLKLRLDGQYSGIRKVVIRREFEHVTTFDYDPGYEEYDMYDEFSWEKNGNPTTTYSLTGPAGFQQNGTDAKYAKFSGSKITTNNRIALNNTNWTFDFGMVPGGNNGDYSFLSICNLREGDRVVISYINDSESPLIFASEGNSETGFTYNGCAAFRDDDRDGVLDEGEKSISQGDVSVEWHRGEGNVGSNDNGIGWNGQNWVSKDYITYTPELNYINSYVITQDGHLDLAFKRNVFTYDAPHDPEKIVSRIVKIKIFSDHQAMMVDKWEEAQKHYKAYYNITGELQAKEHIMPGGLEIFVGNNDASQHALVVSSKDGPVSWVNAVDGFKIPGISKNGNQVNINFDLGIGGDMSKLPTTGTFYRFVPEVKGKMSFKFEGKSMNYYRYDLKGNDIYYNDNWIALNDRPNEQTVDAACPYYLVRVYVDKNDGQKKMEVTRLQKDGQDIYNGGDYEASEFDVEAGEEYYLFGGWNQDGLYYTSSWPNHEINLNSDATDHEYNNIEFRPFDGRTVGCGIAQLLWVTFDPNKKIYPLAKWVPNDTKDVKTGAGVPNPDTFEMEYDLADLWGYDKDHTVVTVKKMSGNIESCHPFLQPTGAAAGSGNPTLKLMIENIQFVSGKNPGGTILIKIDDPSKRENPLYSLTIAYSADEQYDNQQSEVINSNKSETVRGHIWDFHTKSLNGLTWNPQAATWYDQEQTLPKTYVPNTSVAIEMGTYFQNYYSQSIAGYGSALEVQTALPKNDGLNGANESFLYDEVANVEKGDWMFNYNLVYDGNLIDPVFTNKYDMAGDNADMIWDTEGTIFQTSANQCAIFNEYGQVIDHTATTTTDDPNRYVALLKGGVFRIPWLMPNDRVIIWMGSGTGRTDDFAALKIRNAYDAMHNPIDSEDEYIVGGSQWNGKNEDANYRGCYHFFAKGHGDGPADMVFEMVGGEMCKIYKIQIYRGDRIITNEIVDKAATDNQFLLYSTAADPNEDSSEDYTDNTTHEWALKYLGKDQQLANGTGKNTQKNEIIAKTGYYKSENPALTNNFVTVSQENAETGETEEITTSKVESFTYQHSLGEIGTFRMRGKDMEKNMNYVADYADHNVTIAYQETMKYPYTWDFKDMTGFDNIDDLYQPEENIGEVKPTELDESVWNSLDNTSYQKTSRDLSLWEVNGTSGECFLRLNSQSQTLTDKKERDNIFETAQTVDGNQFWANGQVIPETQGLWFYTEDNYRDNCEWYIDSNGMKFNGYNGGTLVVPNVPAGAAVYLRMAALKTDVSKCTFTHQFKDEDGVRTCETYSPQQVGNTNEYIFAIRNNGSKKGKLALSIEGYQLKKLGVSIDKKTLSDYGWATESRERVIDPSLTAYLSGKNIETIIATGAVYASRSVSLQRMDLNEKGDLMQLAEDNGSKYACILHNADKDEPVTVLDGGFHLFVPDMHDYDVKTPANSQKKFTLAEKSIMKAQLTANKVYWSDDDGNTKNFVLTNTYLRVGKDDEITESISSTAKEEGFYRVGKKSPILSSGHQGYLPVSTDIAEGQAKFSIVFVDFEDNFQGITTGITEATPNNENGQMINENAEWYNLNGQKLNGMPNERGIYIVNGKKVMVK